MTDRFSRPPKSAKPLMALSIKAWNDIKQQTKKTDPHPKHLAPTNITTLRTISTMNFDPTSRKRTRPQVISGKKLEEKHTLSEPGPPQVVDLRPDEKPQELNKAPDGFSPKLYILGRKLSVHKSAKTYGPALKQELLTWRPEYFPKNKRYRLRVPLPNGRIVYVTIPHSWKSILKK